MSSSSRSNAGIAADVRDTLPGVIWVFSQDRRTCTYVNPHIETLFGYPHASWLTTDAWRNRLHPDDVAAALNASAACTSLQATRLEYRVRTRAGAFIPVSELLQLVIDGNGHAALHGIAMPAGPAPPGSPDAAEAARIHARFADTFEAVNRCLGGGGGDPLGPAFLQLVSDTFAGTARWLASFEDCPADALSTAVESAGTAPRWLCVARSDGRAWGPEDGQLLFAIGQRVTDLISARSARQAVRDSETRFRLFLDHATDAFFLHDWDGTVLEVNQVACDMLGRTREELIGSQPNSFDPSVTRDQLIGLLKALDHGQTMAVESVHRHKDGRMFPVEVRLRPFWQSGRRHAVATVRDLTEPKRIERERIESLGLLRAIVEGTPDAIYLKDTEGRYQLVNAAAAAILGRDVDSVVGHRDADFFDGESLAVVLASDRAVLESGTSRMAEERVLTGGSHRTFLVVKTPRRDADGRIIGLIGISRDITEVRRLEEQFRQAQKMESVGRLAGGIAHDFNNLLTVINSGTELALDQLPHDWPMRRLLTEVMKAGERAANLTGQLLAFSRKQVLQPRPVSLRTLLSELTHLMRRLLREDIELSLVIGDDAAVAVVDRSQFEQAIINLAVNAKDAMPAGGRLEIGLTRVMLTAADATEDRELTPGAYTRVTVTDNGTGMDEATRRQVFEPFFTTKGPGGGTGLGLAMVYGFMKQSGGHVEVTSTPGHGTTFQLYFPCVEARADEPGRKAAPPAPRAQRDETVLVVEDEASVRGLACLVLRAKGYTVLEATNGRHALDVVRNAGRPIDLVLSDIIMPDMGGQELLARLAEQWPAVRVIFMSGYTDEAAVLTAVQEEQVAFIQKPFTPAELARMVRAALDRTTSRAKIAGHVDSPKSGA